MKNLKLISLSLSIAATICSCDFIDDQTGQGGGPQSPPMETLPIIIAHRGAQSELPEHTIEGYQRAIELGADYIEPDLVMTKDGHLVVRHEPFLSGTTNVADIPEFATYRTTKNLDGKLVTDWFSTDFTLEEIKRLKARQAFSGRSTEFDNLYEIPTFEEVINLVQAYANENIGI